MIIKYAAALAIGFYGTTYAIDSVDQAYKTPNETVVQKSFNNSPGPGWFIGPNKPKLNPGINPMEQAVILRNFCKWVEGPDYTGWIKNNIKDPKKAGVLSHVPSWCRAQLGQEV